MKSESKGTVREHTTIAWKLYNPLSTIARRLKKMANITVSATAGMVFIGASVAFLIFGADRGIESFLWYGFGFAIFGIVSWYWSIAQAKQVDNEARRERKVLFSKLDTLIENTKK